MKIAIVGAGAMGQLFAGRLHRAGHHVVLLEIRDDVRKALTASGITLVSEHGTEHAPVPVHRAEDVTERFELIVIFTKAFHTRAAVQSVRHLVGPETLGVTVQNGLGLAEVLAEAFGADRTVAGVTDFPADLTQDGRVHTTVHGSVRIGLVGSGQGAERVARTLRDAGLNAHAEEDFRVPIWEKVAFNAALNTLSAITGATVGAMGASGEARKIVSEVLGEVERVATAQGIGLSPDRVRAAVGNAFEHHGDHKSSMLMDREAGRPTEVDYIGGAVVDRGRSLGIPIPVLDTLCGLVRMVTEPAPR